MRTKLDNYVFISTKPSKMNELKTDVDYTVDETDKTNFYFKNYLDCFSQNMINNDSDLLNMFIHDIGLMIFVYYIDLYYLLKCSYTFKCCHYIDLYYII